MIKKVYVVEDNEKNMKLFRAILKAVPYIELFEETNGLQAFESIKTDQPDLLILDIQLPDMSGIDICSELRKIEKFKNTPIVAVTSFAMKGDKERILKAGFDDYISKPINIQNFREIIQSKLV